MRKITESEVRKMMTKIFGTKKTPFQQELPEKMQLVIEISKTMGLTWHPVILIEDEAEFTGRYDITPTDYDQPVIRISKALVHYFRGEQVAYTERSATNMAKSLAHELGHVVHGGTYEEEGFAVCERFAESFTVKVMAVVG